MKVDFFCPHTEQHLRYNKSNPIIRVRLRTKTTLTPAHSRRKGELAFMYNLVILMPMANHAIYMEEDLGHGNLK